MIDLLPGYEINKETWFYHSLLVCIAVYFKFSRFWSLRNVDLFLLLLLSPGLFLSITEPVLGQAWLMIGTGVLLIRVLLDSSFKRRPRLEQNLNTSGLAFLCFSTLAFMGANIWSEELPSSTRKAVERGQDLIDRTDTVESDNPTSPESSGPTSSLAATPAVALSRVASTETATEAADIAARLLAMLAHLAVVLGLIFLARWHFGDLHLGLSMSTLYLLLPCTAYNVQYVNHVLPAALIVWALVAYRRPLMSGSLLGFACGTLMFPLFLLPIWASFYGRYGGIRFLGAVAIVATALLLTVVRYSDGPEAFYQQAFGGLDVNAFDFQNWHDDWSGIWNESNHAFRIPVFALYVLMIVAMTLWPRKKNLEHLAAFSAAVVIGTQFWYPWRGGTYVLWYVPLLLVVMFRPRLSHLIAPWRAVSSNRRVSSKPPKDSPVSTLTGGPAGDLF